jgi:hypothetical protein
LLLIYSNVEGRSQGENRGDLRLEFDWMPVDLKSVRAKLARSQEHVQTLKNEAKAWIERNPFSLIKDTNTDSTRFSLIVRINEAPPFERWSLIVGDCTSNLRAALDHLVYAIAAHQAAPSLPEYERKLMFPITDCRAEFNEAIGKRKQLGNISDRVRKAIESMQPYNLPHALLPPVLAILRDLNNTDNHRLLRLVYAAVSTGDVGFVGEWPPEAGIRPATHSEEIQDGTEIFAMISDVPLHNVEYDRTKFSITVSIRHGKRDPSGPEGSDRSDFIALLSTLSTEVRTVIYEVAKSVEREGAATPGH